MKLTSRSKHADRIVLVRSDDSGRATGRRLAAEGATVYAVGLFGEWRIVGAFARCELAEREGLLGHFGASSFAGARDHRR